jgi:spore maturation protein SpmB
MIFLLLGVRKKINIYNVFINGARKGFDIAIGIIPYLVAMLFSIGILRASGTLDFIISGLTTILNLVGLDTEFVKALPTAIMKPLSGGAARGMMIDTINSYGVDSFAAKLAGTFQGSTETTFYTLAVYYGAVKIKNTRYTVTCGLIADLAGIVAAIFIAYKVFL